jgi:hypothetical protein
MTSAVGYFGIGGSTVGNTSFKDAFVVGTSSTSPLVFNTDNTEKMRITPVGYVGIGTNAPTAPLTVNGDVDVSATGSGRNDVGSPNPPREIGLTNWVDGNGARITFGDAWNALQNAYNYRMQITSYHGMEIVGNRRNPSGMGFVLGAASDPSLSVIGTTAAAPVLAVIGAATQSGNLQEWRNSGGTALSAISSTGGATINGAFNYGVDASGTDAYSITLSPAPTAYVAGMMVSFYAGTANTGNCTISINGLAAKNIRKRANTTLVDNDIVVGMVCLLIYDGTNFKIMNPIVP